MIEPIRYDIEILGLEHWDENQYEGAISAKVDGVNLTIHVENLSGEWNSLEAGQSIDAQLVFLRYGKVEKVDLNREKIEQIAGVNYKVWGKVLQMEDENLTLESELPILIDLDIPPRSDIQLEIGDNISIEGVFRLSL